MYLHRSFFSSCFYSTAFILYGMYILRRESLRQAMIHTFSHQSANSLLKPIQKELQLRFDPQTQIAPIDPIHTYHPSDPSHPTAFQRIQPTTFRHTQPQHSKNNATPPPHTTHPFLLPPRPPPRFHPPANTPLRHCPLRTSPHLPLRQCSPH